MVTSSGIAEAPVWDLERAIGRRCKRWSTYPRDVLDLGVAEMDVSACPPVLEAVRDAVAAEAFGYPVPDAVSPVPRATTGWLRGQGLEVDESAIRIVPDVMRGIGVAIRYLTRPGSPVLVPTPTYSRFLEVVPAAGRECREIPLLIGPNGCQLDLDAIEDGLRNGAGSVLLCNPVNPLGAVLERGQLSALAGLADRFGARVIADEVHAPIRYGVPFVPYAAVSEQSRAHAVTVTSATKAWNVPGLRTAMVALTAAGDVEAWGGVRHVETSGATPLGMVATVAALEHGGPWLVDVVSTLRSRRQMVYDRLSDAGLDGISQPPDATYFAWLDLRAWDSRTPAARLLETVGVALGEGAQYGAAGAGFVRLNFATGTAQLARALDLVVEAVRRENAA
ncbi:aminotransferase class I/II-fold pyridoxal phosphate-dependent enzyme [Pseudonocardia sp. MH-G8]|uniref:aminotransferase class I/II-fold pyridoxal phosphate-dependent enzyme n=1 Tax=Pseudonocardia sp. MH-G8 TaxID=1854588 RepID=UPI000BA14E89|nr:aminotransferase class I/II-fold pyridoxal phosphate-dependent enzyme [Pseudonocardia sp. MH-G8]OZM76403.1 aminotransferase class I/II [Pseudonocardia sp. MH-G8]